MSDAREHDVKTCGEECGYLRFRKGRWVDAFREPILRHDNFCPQCGTRVGIDAEGPWREAMVPRADLEQAQADLAHHKRALGERDALFIAAHRAIHFFANAMGQCPMQFHEDLSQVPWCEVGDPEDIGDCSMDHGECWLEGAGAWCGLDWEALNTLAEAALSAAEEASPDE